MTNIISGVHSHVFLTLMVLCVLAAMAMPINTQKDASDEILRKLKQGMLSADSVLYYSREDILKEWVKEDGDVEYSMIFDVVISISNLMNSQLSLKDDRNEHGEPEASIVAVTMLIDVVLGDACDWLSDVLEIEDFNCTANEVERIANHIRAQQSVENIKVALKEYRRLKGLGSCDWIKCNIWCSEEFQSLSNSAKILEYIMNYNDVGCADFSEEDDACHSCPDSVEI